MSQKDSINNYGHLEIVVKSARDDIATALMIYSAEKKDLSITSMAPAKKRTTIEGNYYDLTIHLFSPNDIYRGRNREYCKEIMRILNRGELRERDNVLPDKPGDRW